MQRDFIRFCSKRNVYFIIMTACSVIIDYQKHETNVTKKGITFYSYDFNK
jgi:hypothetical protein